MTNYWAQDSEALTAAATETVIMVTASASKIILVDEIAVSFNGTDAALAPVLVELCRFSSTGTSGATPTRENRSSSGETATATAASNFTAEPSLSGSPLWSTYLTPAGGALPMQWPLGKEIVVPVSGRIGLRFTTASGVAPTVVAGIGWVE